MGPGGIRVFPRTEENMGCPPALPVLFGPRVPWQRAKVQKDNVRERIETPRSRRKDPRIPAERADAVDKRYVGTPNCSNLKTQGLGCRKPKVRASPPDFTAPTQRAILEEPPNQKLIGVMVDPPLRTPIP